jgi:hypothetical protein
VRQYVIELDNLKRDAERAIRAAFPIGEAPSPDAMRNDHCPECSETTARFMGKPWSELVAEDLGGNPEPGCLTAIGFRYYLPAMMLLSLEHPRQLDCFPDGVTGQLSPKGSSLSPQDADRLKFTQAQARAIVAFLRFLELFKKMEWSGPGWPDDAILSVPTERPLERAIDFWTTRASGGAAQQAVAVDGASRRR